MISDALRVIGSQQILIKIRKGDDLLNPYIHARPQLGQLS